MKTENSIRPSHRERGGLLLPEKTAITIGLTGVALTAFYAYDDHPVVSVTVLTILAVFAVGYSLRQTQRQRDEKIIDRLKNEHADLYRIPPVSLADRRLFIKDMTRLATGGVYGRWVAMSYVRWLADYGKSSDLSEDLLALIQINLIYRDYWNDFYKNVREAAQSALLAFLNKNARPDKSAEFVEILMKAKTTPLILDLLAAFVRQGLQTHSQWRILSWTLKKIAKENAWVEHTSYLFLLKAVLENAVLTAEETGRKPAYIHYQLSLILKWLNLQNPSGSWSRLRDRLDAFVDIRVAAAA